MQKTKKTIPTASADVNNDEANAQIKKLRNECERKKSSQLIDDGECRLSNVHIGKNDDDNENSKNKKNKFNCFNMCCTDIHQTREVSKLV